MELLLNLAWLMLALPGLWLWRCAPACHAGRQVGVLRALLLLGCVLVLLFPVVSASDDLHAMRQEMEESNFSKRAVMAAGVQSQSGHTLFAGFLADTVSATWIRPTLVVCGNFLADTAAPPEQIWRCVRSGRAPPFGSSLS
jgi:hypothetical protein